MAIDYTVYAGMTPAEVIENDKAVVEADLAAIQALFAGMGETLMNTESENIRNRIRNGLSESIRITEENMPRVDAALEAATAAEAPE